MTTNSNNRLVDHSAIRVNQSLIISLLILAFVLSSPLIVAFVAGVMLIGTSVAQAGPVPGDLSQHPQTGQPGQAARHRR